MTARHDEPVDGFIGALLDDDPEQLYQRAPCGYLSTTPDGTIVKANQTFLSLVGYTAAELIGRRRFADLLSPGGKIYHETHVAPMLRMHDVAREIALDVVRKDGGRLPVLVNAVLERDPGGAPVVVRTAVFDATQRREYERELLREKERAEASEARASALARTLQQTLIPPTPPSIPQLDVAAHYRPAGDGSEVGGDFYDVFQTGAGEWAVVIGDVCGKGVEAAVVTALARYTLHAAAMQQESPSHALGVLNGVLRQRDTERFCTVAFVRLARHRRSWRARLSSAGHPSPLHRRADGTTVAVGRPGTLLGVVDALELSDDTFDLSPGDALVLYTDGVPEARRGRSFYGEERLLALLGRPYASAAAIATAILDDVLGFQHGTARDDIAVVAARVPDA